jgi:hypothetical protein
VPVLAGGQGEGLASTSLRGWAGALVQRSLVVHWCAGAPQGAARVPVVGKQAHD